MVIEMFMQEFNSYFLTYLLTNFSAPKANKCFENVAMFKLASDVCVTVHH